MSSSGSWRTLPIGTPWRNCRPRRAATAAPLPTTSYGTEAPSCLARLDSQFSMPRARLPAVRDPPTTGRFTAMPLLVFTPSGAVARIIGLTLTLPDGQQCDLIETGRTVEGVTHEPIEDPDLYRALVDAALVAQECRDLRTFERVRPLIDLARFSTCPACLDRFDRYEDCPTCAGQGFVTKPAATGLL